MCSYDPNTDIYIIINCEKPMKKIACVLGTVNLICHIREVVKICKLNVILQRFLENEV